MLAHTEETERRFPLRLTILTSVSTDRPSLDPSGSELDLSRRPEEITRDETIILRRIHRRIRLKRTKFLSSRIYLVEGRESRLSRVTDSSRGIYL